MRVAGALDAQSRCYEVVSRCVCVRAHLGATVFTGNVIAGRIRALSCVKG